MDDAPQTHDDDPLNSTVITREVLDEWKRELRTLRRLHTDAVSIFRMMAGKKPNDDVLRLISEYQRTDPSTGEVAPVVSILVR